ncbi:hypothetical protein BDC45DRAFT_542260 [Circinella umbellata]|nr:hypothetical protein BDC45DRAFT_542260 [Circinella umbellata]
MYSRVNKNCSLRAISFHWFHWLGYFFFTFFHLEIICIIFGFLPPEAIAESALVSKLWAQQLFRCDSCWSKIIVTELSGGDFLHPCQQLTHIIHHVHHLTLPYGSHYLQLFLNRMAHTHSDTHFKSITFASYYTSPKSQTRISPQIIKTRLARIGSKITIDSIHFIKQEATSIRSTPKHYPLVVGGWNID